MLGLSWPRDYLPGPFPGSHPHRIRYELIYFGRCGADLKHEPSGRLRPGEPRRLVLPHPHIQQR